MHDFQTQQHLPAAHTLLHRENHQEAGRYLREVVFAASDGLVTTFAVVTGSAGAHLAPFVIIVLGVANLIADGISMGLGEYLGSKSERSFYDAQQRREAWEIQHMPDAEEAEIREILRGWGFAGSALEQAVATIIRNPAVWVDIMMKYELGLQRDEAKSPQKSGLVMFVSFATIGILPVLPYLLRLSSALGFSLLFAGLGMFTVGALRARFTLGTWWKSGLEMLFVGAIAAGSAYGIGSLLSAVFQIR